MEIVGSLRVNTVKVFGSNIQYALLLLKDRMLFVKVGGQFADFRYILLGYALPMLVFGLAGLFLGWLILGSVEQAVFLEWGMMGGASLGMMGGIWVGAILAKKIRPSRRKTAELKDLANFSEDELINRDKRNFMILFEDISRIELQKLPFGINGPCAGKIEIGWDKYDIAPGQNYDEIAALVSGLLPTKSKTLSGF